MQAYFVDAEREAAGDEEPLRMRYVAIAHTPEAAVEAVRPLVSADAVINANGSTLSMSIARAIGIRPGHARLV